MSNINIVNEKNIVRRISLVSLLGNFGLSLFKLFAGIYGKSNAMISDCIHSFSDVATTLIAYLGFQLSNIEADEEHPYGHERIECVASLLLGAALFMTGISIGKFGITSIVNSSKTVPDIPKTIALVAAIISIVSKELMFWYTRYYAKLINSSVFMADAWHHRSDALSSIGSLFGIGASMLGYPIGDALASIIICIFIVKVAIDIIKEAIAKVIDTSCDKEYNKRLKSYIESQDNVIKVDTLYSRMFSNKVYVDLEMQVDGNLTLKEAHSIAEQVHDNVEQNFKDIKHITIHLNPSE